MLSILYIAGVIVCVAAMLLAALLSLLRKKAVAPVVLYGVCVLLVLGIGFVFPDFDPFLKTPAVRSSGVVTSNQTNAPATQPIVQEQESEQELELTPPPPQEDDVEETPPETVEEAEDAEPKAEQEPSKKTTSTQKPAPTPSPAEPAETPAPEPTPEPVTQPTTEPVTQTVPEPVDMDENGPVLVDEPGASPVPNPALNEETHLATISNPTLEEDGATGNSSTEYIHSFTGGVLLGAINSNKYHCKDCQAARKIPRENEIWFNSVEEAEAQGYEPCGICYQ